MRGSMSIPAPVNVLRSVVRRARPRPLNFRRLATVACWLFRVCAFRRPHPVVNLLRPVEADDQREAVLIQEANSLVVEQGRVRRDVQRPVHAAFCGDIFDVGRDAGDEVPIEQRLPAEESDGDGSASEKANQRPCAPSPSSSSRPVRDSSSARSSTGRRGCRRASPRGRGTYNRAGRKTELRLLGAVQLALPETFVLPAARSSAA